MALKKPSDFFGKKSDDKETLVFTEEKLPEKFDAYKNNLNNIEVLKEFTDNFGSFSENIARVQTLEETIVELREEISSTLSKEDLDNAMMSNLLVLEENVDKIQKSLKGINRKDLKEIYENVEEISNQVLYVVEELPRHKSLIKSQEVSFDKRLQGYQQSIDEQLTEFNEYLASRLNDLSIQQQEDTEYLKATLEGINQQSLDEITSSVRDIQTEVPKYKNSINKKFAEFTEKVGSYQNQISEKLEEVQSSFLNLVEEELPKYQSLLTQSKIENDEKFERISHKLSEEIENLTEQNQKLNVELEEKSSSLEQSFLNKITEFEKTLSSSKQTLEETNQTYKDVYCAIETKGLKDQGRFDEQEQLISNLNNEISVVLEQISETKTEIQQLDYVTPKELSEAQKQFQKKLNLIENDIQHQSSKLKSENQSLTETVLSLQKHFQKTPEELIEDYQNLSKKITHLESIFEKFNEKTILTEELANPSEKNSDPLTPTNQKFVTLEQLQEHYRLFINRVQQQLASIGGGGETRLEFLDDVDRNSAKTDGYVLAYQASTGRFIGTEVSTSGISTYADVAGISTVSEGLTGTPNINVGSIIASDATFSGIVTASNSAVVQTGTATTALIVEGDARVTGILTVGTSSITLDGDTNQVNVGTGVTIHHTNGVQVGGNNLHSSGLTLNHFNVSGISTLSQLDITNGINVSGVITATQFIGDFSGNSSTATYATTAGIATYSEVSGISTYAETSGISTYSSTSGIATYATSSGIATYATTSGVSTYSSVAGISTVSEGLTGTPNINVGSIIASDATFSGNVSVAGTITYEDVTNVDSIGIITARNSAVIKAGTATTALLVEGDTRIVGILTIGTSSITLDGDVNQVNVGNGVTIHHTNGVQVGGNTLHTSGLTLNHVNLSGITTLGTVQISSGIVTAVSGIVTYYGDGQYLQNILSGVGVATAGGVVGTGATILDFRGAGISTVTVAAGIATINIVGGGGGGAVSIGTIAPPSPSNGDLWYSPDYGRTFVWYNEVALGVGSSAFWVDASPFNIPSTPTAAKSTTTLTASEGQATFNASYTSGYVDVYLNGIRLSDSEFVATNGTSITLVQAASNGDLLDVVEYTMGKGDAGPSGPLSPVVSISTNTTYYPLFVSGIGTVDPYVTTTSNYFEFNPSSGTLEVNQLVVSGIVTASGFSGSGASLTTLNASNISSGTVPTARLATGTADSTTYLRGDQTWATVTSGITITNDTSTNATRYLTFTSATSGSISAENVSSTKLTFNPSTGALSATDFNSTSDVNLKENISTIEDSISKINSLRGVSFSWKETNKKSYGVIAQELEEVLPELVNTAEIKSVNYNGLIGVLIEAVKEQQEQINTLKREIEDLRNER